MTGRLDDHNISVSQSISGLGACGNEDLRTGRTCLLPARHPGSCALAPYEPAAAGVVEQYLVADTLVVRLGAGADERVCARLQQKLRAAWDSFDAVVVDLSDVHGLGPQYLDALVRLRRVAGRHGIGFVFVAADPRVAVVLRDPRLAGSLVVHGAPEAVRVAAPLGGPVLSRSQQLPRTSSAPGQARTFVRTVTGDWQLDGEITERALDVCSELVTNALKHARRRLVQTVELSPRHVTVQVWDDSHELPHVKPYRAGVSQSGLGLHLVEQLATCWGYRTAPDGKYVWATVARHQG